MPEQPQTDLWQDSLTLATMITEREQAMINKDISSALSQFSEDATWINSQGYYFGEPSPTIEKV